MVCGGANGTINEETNEEHIDVVYKDCYSLDFEKEQWTKLNVTLSEPKYRIGNIVIDDQLMISGGQTGDNEFNSKSKNFLDTTELIGLEATSSLPSLPINVSNHCIIRINHTHLMATGGETEDTTTSKTFFFNIPKKKWESGPQLNLPRKAHACTLDEFFNNYGYFPYVFGGFADPNNTGRIKYWDSIEGVNSSGKWNIRNTKLPRSLRGQKINDLALVTSDPSVINEKVTAILADRLMSGGLIGQSFEATNQVFLFDTSGTPWPSILELATARAYHIAFQIPNELASLACCSSSNTCNLNFDFFFATLFLLFQVSTYLV